MLYYLLSGFLLFNAWVIFAELNERIFFFSDDDV